MSRHRTRRVILLLVLLVAAGIGAYFFWARIKETSSEAGPLNKASALQCSQKLSDLTSAPRASSSRTLEFSEVEVASYIHYELSQYFPKGLREVQVKLLDNAVSADASIDFDQLQPSGHSSKNPLFGALLKGEHRLQLAGRVSTQKGVGRYEIVSVGLDHHEIPRPLVDLLVKKLLLPRYPSAAPDTDFPLPFSIDKMEFLPGRLLVHQNGG